MNGTTHYRATARHLCIRPAFFQLMFFLPQLVNLAVLFDIAYSEWGGGLADQVLRTVLIATYALFLAAVAVGVPQWLLQKAQLEAGKLYRRGILGTRSVDLAGAQVWLKPLRQPSVLLARDDHTGTKVALPVLVPGRGLLPPDDLVALAAAIEVGGNRSADDGQQAWAVAAHLRHLAADPHVRATIETGQRKWRPVALIVMPALAGFILLLWLAVTLTDMFLG